VCSFGWRIGIAEFTESAIIFPTMLSMAFNVRLVPDW
jgi:hypothetical protein